MTPRWLPGGRRERIEWYNQGMRDSPGGECLWRVADMSQAVAVGKLRLTETLLQGDTHGVYPQRDEVEERRGGEERMRGDGETKKRERERERERGREEEVGG